MGSVDNVSLLVYFEVKFNARQVGSIEQFCSLVCFDSNSISAGYAQSKMMLYLCVFLGQIQSPPDGLSRKYCVFWCVFTISRRMGSVSAG